MKVRVRPIAKPEHDFVGLASQNGYLYSVSKRFKIVVVCKEPRDIIVSASNEAIQTCRDIENDVSHLHPDTEHSDVKIPGFGSFGSGLERTLRDVKSVVVISAMLAIVIAGCGKETFTQSNLRGDNVFRYALDANPATLDPALSQDLVTGDLMRQVFEGLVTLDESNLIKPLLAERWEITQDGKLYTFKLKPGVMFHDGSALIAQDFVDSFHRAAHPSLASPIATNYLGDIEGAVAYIEGKAQSIMGVSAPDERTLKVRLVAPRAYFLGKLTYPVCAAVSPRAIGLQEEIKSVEQMSGTGPFRMASYTPEQAAVLKSFEGYHGGSPSISGLELNVIKDPSTRINKFKAGELDLVGLPQEDVEAFKRDAKLSRTLQKTNRPGLIYLGLNKSAEPLFDSLAARQSFARAINKPRIVNDILGGVGVVANGILPPGMPGYRPNLNPLKDVRVGRWRPDPDTTLELVIGGQSTDRRKVAEAIATQLNQELGIRVTVRNMELGAYLQKANKKQLGFFMGTWFADYLDPENFLSVTLSEAGQNRVAYDSQLFNDLCRRADASMDEKERIVLYQAAEETAVIDAVWIPIYFQQEVIAISPRVRGLRRNLMGTMPYTSVSLEP